MISAKTLTGCDRRESSTTAWYPAITPAASSRRTRSSEARGDSPTVCASFWMVERPSRCKATRILTSMRSRAGARLAAMNHLPSVEGLLLDRHRIVERKPAAIGVDRLSRHVACLRGGKEDSNRCDLIGLADAPERRARQYSSLGLLVGRDRLENVRQDRAGPDGVDPDAVGRERKRHHLGQLIDAAFRHAIRRVIGDRDDRVDRADIDDAARLLAGLDLRHHAPRRRLADEKRALEVHAQNAVEVGFRQIEEIGRVDDAGIVDKDVEIAERAAGFGDHALGFCRVPDVGGKEASVAEVACGSLAGGGVDIGDREPDAARGASDDRDLVLQPHAALRVSLEGSTPAHVVPALRGMPTKRQRCPNRRSRNQPSSERLIACGRTDSAPPWPTGASLDPGDRRGFGSAEANDAAPVSPGRDATGTPWWATFMKRDQMSTGRAPPVAFLVGEESSLPSQTPVTRWPV